MQLISEKLLDFSSFRLGQIRFNKLEKENALVIIGNYLGVRRISFSGPFRQNDKHRPINTQSGLGPINLDPQNNYVQRSHFFIRNWLKSFAIFQIFRKSVSALLEPSHEAIYLNILALLIFVTVIFVTLLSSSERVTKMSGYSIL